MAETWNLSIAVNGSRSVTVSVPKDCYVTHLITEIARNNGTEPANVKLAFNGAEVPNQQFKRLSDYGITNGAQLSMKPIPVHAAEFWDLTVTVSGERRIIVRVPKDCYAKVLFEEVAKQTGGLAGLRLSFQGRELVNNTTTRLSDYDISNNAHLTMMQRVSGGGQPSMFYNLIDYIERKTRELM